MGSVIQVVKGILLVVSALFPIVDPIGGSPIFLSLTRDYTTETRKLLSRRIAVDSFILLVASYAVGSHVLSFFGISLPVVQVGGGLVVISTGWSMLNQKDGNDRNAVRRTVNCKDALNDAFYPLTLAEPTASCLSRRKVRSSCTSMLWTTSSLKPGRLKVTV